MLINISNHPYSQWGEEQRKAAKAFGDCRDFPFPAVDPHGDEHYLLDLTREIVLQISRQYELKGLILHIMGEMTLTYALVTAFKDEGCHCIASTSERIVNELPHGQKEVTFSFVRFREY